MFSSREEKLKFVENHRKRSEHNCVDVGYHFVINNEALRDYKKLVVGGF